jgi:hypothetical protein
MQKNMMTNFLISISQTTNEIYKNIIILKWRTWYIKSMWKNNSNF